MPQITYQPDKYNYGSQATGDQMYEVHMTFYEDVEADDFFKYDDEDPMWDIDCSPIIQVPIIQDTIHEDKSIRPSGVDYELIEITTKQRSAKKIRESYYRQNVSPIDRVTGADGVRKFYNDKNLRRRIKISITN